MRTVYKYRIPIEDDFELRLPYGSEILHVDTQGGEAFMWSRVTPGAAEEIRRFRVRGTGHPDAEGFHIGTIKMGGGSLVFHVFEVIRDKTELDA